MSTRFVRQGREILKFLSNTTFYWLSRLPIDVDAAAVVIMESFGVVSFIIASLFFRQFQRMNDKQRAFLNAIEKRLVGERGDGNCFSSEWVKANIVYRPRNLLNATPLLLATVATVLGAFYYLVMPRFLTSALVLGYANVIVLIGIAILLWTDAFEAYRYTNSIRKVATEQLDREDQSYIELAREALQKASLRFFSLGIAFALIGPFIPEIFNSVVYVLALCATVFFQASEASLNVSKFFGVLILLMLPALMLFLPEILSRIIIQRGKSLARRVFKR